MVRLKRKYTSLLKWMFYALYLSLAFYVLQILHRDNLLGEEQKNYFPPNRTFRNIPQKVEFTFVTHRNEVTAVTQRNMYSLDTKRNQFIKGWIY